MASAGRAQTATLGAVVSLDGAGSSDPQSLPLIYSWNLSSRPAGSAATLSSGTVARPAFLADKAGRYVATLIVSNGGCSSAPATVAIDISANQNAAPTASADGARAVTVGAVVSLDGSASSDADGDTLKYAWTLTNRPTGSAAELLAPDTSRPVFLADVAGTYVASLVVNDGVLSSQPVIVTIVASSGNVEPVAKAAGPATAGTNSVVTLDGNASSDGNGDAITYAWSWSLRPAGSGAMLAGADTVAPTFVPDLPGTYVATLVVNDGRLNSRPANVSIGVAQLPTRAFIRSGGAGYTTMAGQAYAADQHYTGGSPASTTSLISGTPDDGLYQSERWGDFRYSIPLADGFYRVTIHQAERYSGINGPGQRVFDLRLEPGEAGEKTITDIDIYGTVGPNAAYDIDEIVQVTGGRLDIVSGRKVQEPRISAISVVPLAEAIARQASLTPLMRKAVRLLAGSGYFTCSGSVYPMAIGYDNIQFQYTNFPVSALFRIGLQVSPDNALTTTLEFLLSGSTRTIAFKLDSGGFPVSLSTSSQYGTGETCQSASTGRRWSTYAGDGLALLNGVAKPRARYDRPVMQCSFSNLGGQSGSGPAALTWSNFSLTGRFPTGTATTTYWISQVGYNGTQLTLTDGLLSSLYYGGMSLNQMTARSDGSPVNVSHTAKGMSFVCNE